MLTKLRWPLGTTPSQQRPHRVRTVQAVAYKGGSSTASPKTAQVCHPCPYSLMGAPVRRLTANLADSCNPLWLQEPNRVLKASLDTILSSYYGTLSYGFHVFGFRAPGTQQSRLCMAAVHHWSDTSDTMTACSTESDKGGPWCVNNCHPRRTYPKCCSSHSKGVQGRVWRGPGFSRPLCLQNIWGECKVLRLGRVHAARLVPVIIIEPEDTVRHSWPAPPHLPKPMPHFVLQTIASRLAWWLASDTPDGPLS